MKPYKHPKHWIKQSMHSKISDRSISWTLGGNWFIMLTKQGTEFHMYVMQGVPMKEI